MFCKKILNIISNNYLFSKKKISNYINNKNSFNKLLEIFVLFDLYEFKSNKFLKQFYIKRFCDKFREK
jgi:hypothetical protein